MSKIKTTRLQARTDNGTLTIGTPNGGTHFEGDVVIPNYVTKKEVADIIAGDVDLGLYQKTEEKDTPRGYAGLGIDGRVSPERVDTDNIVEQLDSNTATISTNTAKIAALESDTAFRIHYNVGNKDGSDPTTSFMGINADTWAGTTQVKLNNTDADGNTHDFSTLNAGDTMWFSDPSGVESLGSYVIDSVTVGAMLADFNVTSVSSRGSPQINDRIESKVFASQDIAEKADITYVDTQDNWIKANYMPLTGGTDHKLAGDIYAAQHNIKGLRDPVDGNDAVSRIFGDGRYLKLSGGTMADNLDMAEHKIMNLDEPIDPTDAATKDYVDNKVSGGRRYLFTSAGKSSGSYGKGDLFFTTENNVAYTVSLADARYICFSYYDRDDGFWHFATASGNVTAPPCNIYLLYDGHTLGAFVYDGSTIGAYTGTYTGNLVVPVTEWISTTQSVNATANAGYTLNCEWFS